MTPSIYTNGKWLQTVDLFMSGYDSIYTNWKGLQAVNFLMTGYDYIYTNGKWSSTEYL